MNLTVLVLAVLLGSVIAYLADRLGRTLGKTSLLGMRPRTTAEVLTAAAGGLIPLVTILIILAVSADARLYILHYNETIRQRDELNKEVQQDKITLKDTQNQKDEESRSMVVINGKLKGLQTQVGQVSDELSTRTAELKTANERFRIASGQIRGC